MFDKIISNKKSVDYETELTELGLLDDRKIWFGGYASQRSNNSIRRNNLLFLIFAAKRKVNLLTVKDGKCSLVRYKRDFKVIRSFEIKDVNKVFKRRGNRLRKFMHIKFNGQRGIRIALNFNEEKADTFLKEVK